MSDTIEKTFIVPSSARLELSNIRGSIEIRPGDDGVIHVTATKRSSHGDAERTEIEMTQYSDGTVKVATRFPEAGWGWLIGSFPCPVDYVVQAPRLCSLKVRGVSSEAYAEGFEGELSFETVSGEVTLRKLTGPVSSKTVSGEMDLTELTGDLRVHTVSGKISGKRLNGALRLETVSGEVSLDESSFPSVDATTVSGKMSYQTPLGAGPYRFNSVSGNVELLVPSETHCSAEMQAISGKLSTRLPATSTSRQNGSQFVEVQGGGVKVFLHSVSGDLSLAS